MYRLASVDYMAFKRVYTLVRANRQMTQLMDLRGKAHVRPKGMTGHFYLTTFFALLMHLSVQMSDM